MWCAFDEPGALGSVEYKLMEESYMQAVEYWGIDPGHKVLQIFAYASELEVFKSWEDRARG